MSTFELPVFAPAAELASRHALHQQADHRLVSLALVGSATTGEACFSRHQPSDLDLFAVFTRPLTASAAFKYRADVVACLAAQGWGTFSIGVRSRGICELYDFHEHMRSWGYDLYGYSQTLAGTPLPDLLGERSPLVSNELLLRNLLGQLWWAVSARGLDDWEPPHFGYVLARALCELLHFTLCSEGIFYATATRRVASVSEEHSPHWLRQWLPAFETALAIRCGRLVPSGEDLFHMGTAWRKIFTQTCLQIGCKATAGNSVRAWFPVGALDTPDGELCELLARAAEITLGADAAHTLVTLARSSPLWRQISPALVFLLCMYAEVSGRFVHTESPMTRDAPSLYLIYATGALKYLQTAPAFIDAPQASFGALRQHFASLQLRRCPAAFRDLYPHLSHLVKSTEIRRQH